MKLIPLAKPAAQRFPGMRRYANGLGLFIDGPADRLLDPVGAVSRKTKSLGRVEFVDGMHEAQIALFYDIEKIQPGAVILFGDWYNEAEIALYEFFLGR